MTKIGFIGCGNMGSAIASALTKNGSFQVYLYDAYKPCLEAFITAHPEATACESVQALLEASETIVVAVKPQILPTLYPQLKKASEKNFISIAAGVPLEVLSGEIGAQNIVRFMPNIAAKVASAVTAVASLESTSDDFQTLALTIASSFGSAFFLDEALFPAFIGISGSAIAFVFEFIHALAMGGCQCGIAYPKSVEIVRDTLLSACALQQESGENPVQLLTKVCSAAGTTIQGMQALYQGDFDATLMNAVASSCQKSIELEQSARNKMRENR